MATVAVQNPPSGRRHVDESFPEEGYPDDLREEMAWLRARYLEQREELLAQRSLIQRCLELREVVEAHIIDLGDRVNELDLSLAGVSDSIWRHGKAISALLVDQHQQLSMLLQLAPQFAADIRTLNPNNLSEGRLLGDHQAGGSRGDGYDDAGSHGRPFPNAWRNEDLRGSPLSGPGKGVPHSVPPEMSDCVASVLSRIEEALTKLSGRPECNFGSQSDSPHSTYSQPGQEHLHNVPKQETQRPASAPRPPRNSDLKHLVPNLGSSRDAAKTVPLQGGYSPGHRRTQSSGQSMTPGASGRRSRPVGAH